MGVWDGYLKEHRSSRYSAKATYLKQLVEYREQIRKTKGEIARLTGEGQFRDAFKTIDHLKNLAPEVAHEEDAKVQTKLREHVADLLGKGEFSRAKQIEKDLSSVRSELARGISHRLTVAEILSRPASPERKSDLVAFLDRHPECVEEVIDIVTGEAGKLIEEPCRRFERGIEKADAITRNAFEAAVRHLDAARAALKAYASDFGAIPAIKAALDRLQRARIDRLESRLHATLTIRSKPGGATVSLNGRDIGTTPLVKYEYVASRCKYRVSVRKKGWGSLSAIELLVEGDAVHEFTLVKPTLPPGFNRFWTITDGDVDQYGNPVVEREGSRFDPKTRWPYEIWLARVKVEGFLSKKRLVTASNWMEFVLLPAGQYVISDLASELRGVGSRHVRKETVRLRRAQVPNPLYVGKYEVTRAQLAAYGPWEGKYLESPSPKHPAYPVPWVDATKFCKALVDATETDARLPTDTEWEAACRAGTTTSFPWGDRLRAGCGNFAVGDEEAKISPVGRFPPNRFGLYDVIGGVSEWCAANEAIPASHALCRGGNFMNVTSDVVCFMLTSYYRCCYRKDTRGGYHGFRVCVPAQ